MGAHNVIDKFNRATAAGLGTPDLGASIEADTISESTSSAGVTVDGVLLKDSSVDRSAAGALAVGAATATSVVITPATTVTGVLTSSGGITLGDNKNISFTNANGGLIGTNNAQKIGFWGTTPVVRQGAVSTLANDANSNINTVIQSLNQMIGIFSNMGIFGN